MKQLFTFLAVVLLAVTTHAQVGIGTTSPDNSAALEVQSTTKGFLPPRLTEEELQAISSPAEGLMVYCTDCATKGLYVFNYNFWQSIISPDVLKTLVVDVTSSTGKTWMDRNLGASRVPTSSTDSEAYGDLYQWGRFTDGHQSRTSSTTSTNSDIDTPGHGDFILEPSSPQDWRSPQNDNLWQGVSGTNNPCSSGYRLPTETELDAERTNWGSNNAAGAFASPLKLPVAGRRSYSNGALTNIGSYGFYWSSTVSGTSARLLYFYSSNAHMNSFFRAYGFSVRCIKD